MTSVPLLAVAWFRPQAPAPPVAKASLAVVRLKEWLRPGAKP
jgi:hypothetical protein